MKKPILEDQELKSLGFTFLGQFGLENNEYYKWWQIKKNDSTLDVTYEYSSNNNLTCASVDFNGEVLLGKELTGEDIKLLIEIM